VGTGLRLRSRRGLTTLRACRLDSGAACAWPALGQGVEGCGARPGAVATPRAARARSVHGDWLALRFGGLQRPAARTQTDFRTHRATAHLSADAAALNAVIRAAAELQDVCESERWRYCIIGGLAVQRWGAPRETVDVDLTLLTGFTDEARFVSTLLAHFEPRIDHAVEFARDKRVLLLKASSGVGLDIALGGLPFEELAVSRSSLFTFPSDVPLRTCSAEDLAAAARTARGAQGSTGDPGPARETADRSGTISVEFRPHFMAQSVDRRTDVSDPIPRAQVNRHRRHDPRVPGVRVGGGWH
jgi:hypothetical protein